MKRIAKETLGLAGEYAVASELCRRELYSQLTLGNHKRTDILVETKTHVLRISVKAKQGGEWPAVNGPVRTDDFIVFVDFLNKELTDALDFYILNLEDWNQLVTQETLRLQEKGILLTQKEDGTILSPDGFKGINVKVKYILGHKGQWDKITSIVDPVKTQAEGTT